jgi:hypothetical protein
MKREEVPARAEDVAKKEVDEKIEREARPRSLEDDTCRALHAPVVDQHPGEAGHVLPRPRIKSQPHGVLTPWLLGAQATVLPQVYRLKLT